MSAALEDWVLRYFAVIICIDIHKGNYFTNATIYLSKQFRGRHGNPFLKRMFDLKEHAYHFLKRVASHV
jgi:hypothetical protein